MPRAIRFISAALLALLVTSPAMAGDFDAGKVLSGLTDLLRERYFDPAVADAVIRKLDADAGRLEKIDDRAAFARAVTADMASVAHDPHLRLLDRPDTVPETAPSPHDADEIERARNYGLASVSIMPGNIGCLTLSGFARFTPKTAERLAGAFNFLADTYGLVIDVTNSRGGDPATEAAIVRYLVGPGITLDSMRTRDGSEMPVVTPQSVAGQLYGVDRPVAVAVSGKTISAAESLPYDLQALKRARIFGERTRGGANPGTFMPLTDGFIAFIPLAQAVNAITHKNWEGAGVIPDAAVPAGKAVDAARVSLVKALLSNEKDAVKRTVLARGLT